MLRSKRNQAYALLHPRGGGGGPGGQWPPQRADGRTKAKTPPTVFFPGRARVAIARASPLLQPASRAPPHTTPPATTRTCFLRSVFLELATMVRVLRALLLWRRERSREKVRG